VVTFVARKRSCDQAGKVNELAHVVLRPKREKMWNAFEQRVGDIDRCEQGEDDEEGTVICVVMLLVIDEFIECAFWREQEQGREKKNGGRDENEDEQEKRPSLLVAPAIEDPPGEHEIEKEICNPNNVDLVNAFPRARLEHFSDAGEHTRHAQGKDDRDEN
jgi:hypothetical protein